MRAAVIEGPDSPPAVREVPSPVPGPGEELIAVSSAALNPHDQVVAAGINFAAPYPYVTGIDCVGRMEDGRRVYVAPTNPPNGSLAEYTVIPAPRAIPIPDGLRDDQALGIGMAGTTAWLALTWKGQLEAGQSVLVTAATGAVGQVAVQAAKVLGASRVVAAGRNRDVLEGLRHRGADETLVIDDAYAKDLAATAGDGFDLVVDGLYGDYIGPAIRATRRNGRVVNFGMRAGRSATISGIELKGRELIGFATTDAGPERIREAYERMVEHVLDGTLVVAAESMPIRDIAVAWQRQRDSPNTKLVLTV
jgi:NADPH:quinone reductase-like Zn-dependent oxidoreductase